MTKDPSLADTQPMPIKRSWNWLFYVVAALALIGLLAWATQKELARNPARDATAELGPYGLVTIRFSTNPSPALPTGTVRLSFMPMDSRQRSIALDRVSFEYGREGDDRPLGSGEAQLMSDGSGMFTPALALHPVRPQSGRGCLGRASAVQVWAARNFPRSGIGGYASG